MSKRILLFVLFGVMGSVSICVSGADNTTIRPDLYESSLENWWHETYLKNDYLLIDNRDVTNYQDLLKSTCSSIGNCKVASKNTAFLRLLLDEAESLESMIDDKLSSNIYHENIILYKQIQLEHQRISDLARDILDAGYKIEKAEFKRLVGSELYGDGDVESTLAALLNYSSWRPQPGYLYSLEFMQVHQVLSGGALITQHPYVAMTNRRYVYIKTKRRFVDGESLEGFYASLNGVYKYQSLVGPKTVYSFNLHSLGQNQLVKGKRFYFYPMLLDISGMEEMVTNEALKWK